MQDLNVVNDTQAPVVEAQASPVENGGQDDNISPGQAAEATDRTQDADTNHKFRKLRLKLDQYQKQVESLEGRLKEFEGKDYEAMAQTKQKLIDMYADEKIKRDLEGIKRLDPSVSSLGELGDNFLKLIANGIDAKTAFYAVRGHSAGGFEPKIPQLGKLEATGGAASEYFTSAQLDRLTDKDLSDPKIFKKAMLSLTKL